MKKQILFLMLLALSASAMAGAPKFGKYFDGRTLRVDCLRRGSAQHDTVWVERFLDRNAEWHGPRKQLIDPIGGADYSVEMRDARTNRVIYSQGYNNLFREYRDTPEGRTVEDTFEEVLLLPMPKAKVRIALRKRNAQMQMVDATVVDFDPKTTPLESRFRRGVSRTLMQNGKPSEKVDVVIVAQGYTPEQEAQLSVDYFRMKQILFDKEPFRSHQADFNLYGVRGNAGATYGTFGADRYLMTRNLFILHDLIGDLPCDYIIIMVNDTTYGGGAIYNFYSVSSLHRMAEYVLTHELGHGIGGLADEYVDEELSYASMHRTAYEPLEPNITNLVDFDSKWKSLLSPDTPVPTPINSTPRTECGPLGAYEGAGYSATGVYRPTMNCMMRNYAPFCPVCSQRLEAVIKRHTN